jgi:hypothetical protein
MVAGPRNHFNTQRPGPRARPFFWYGVRLRLCARRADFLLSSHFVARGRRSLVQIQPPPPIRDLKGRPRQPESLTDDTRFSNSRSASLRVGKSENVSRTSSWRTRRTLPSRISSSRHRPIQKLRSVSTRPRSSFFAFGTNIPLRYLRQADEPPLSAGAKL